MDQLVKCNYCTHEAGHIIASLSLGLDVEAELGVKIMDIGSVSAMTWHYFGTPEDDLFILFAGIETNKHFNLGDAGCLKDWADIQEIIVSVDDLDDPEAWKKQVQQNARAFIAENQIVLLQTAYALFTSEDGKLSAQETRDIWLGKTKVKVSDDFLQILDRVSNTEWQLVKR